MSATTPEAPPRDPTLAALVPRPSPWRHVVVAVAALALLVTVGVVGVAARIGASDGGGGSQLMPDGHILEDHGVVATGWPRLTATSVTAPSGTRVVHAWLVPPSAHLAAPDGSVPALVGALERDGSRYELPRAVQPGVESRLVLDLEIVSCSSLAAATDPNLGWSTATSADGTPLDPAAPRLHLRTALGTQRDVALTSAPWSLDDLHTYSSCPD